MIDAPMEQDYTSIHSKTFSRRKSMPHSLSVSGLVYALLARFNSIFQNVHIDHGEGEESDAVAEQEKDQQHCLNEQHLPTSFGRSEKGYKGMAVLVSNEPSSKMTMLAPLSWRAILYLLHILNDVLVLSGKSRTDLRLWLYRSRHCLSATGGSRYCGGSNDNFHGSNDSANVDKEKMKPHPRIEGLPARYSSQCRTESGCGEALWTVNCRSNMSDETKVEWDPMTMPQSCNTFFEILVGLMKGNVFGYSRMENHVESSFLGMEKMILQLVQRKAIDLVSKLMSDAPPFDHAKFSQGNPTTPYLWKFWFDSLLPLYSQTVTIATDKKAKASASLTDSASNADAAQQAASDQLLKNDLSPGDFFSIWDKMAQRSGNEIFLNYTELLKPKTATNSNIPPTKGRSSRGNHNVSSASETARRELDTTPQELKYREQLLSVDIKCRTLNLLSFLIFSSSSIHHNLYQQPSMSHGLNDASSGILCQKETTNLARRILIAIIDEVDGCILPCMSANATSGSQIRDLEQCLQLCHACVHFLLVLCQSDEGIQTVRLQLRLDSGQGDHSRWSSSAISCMILILKSTLSHAMAAEENESKAQINSDISVLLNTIVAQCIIFFKTLLLFVHNQQHQQPKSGSSYSKYGTTSLLALISEKRLDFLSCCHNILSHDSPANTNMLNDRSLFHISDDLKHDVRMLLEEVLIDEDEENSNER